jgi:hypothetical protein
MSPVWIFEGSRTPDPVAERNLVERKLTALVDAIKQHENEVRREPAPRPQDHQLYERLRDIEQA